MRLRVESAYEGKSAIEIGAMLGHRKWFPKSKNIPIILFVITANFGHSEEERAARKVWPFMGPLFLFGAMEEIFWGQRILGIETPEWFLRHNRGAENQYL